MSKQTSDSTTTPNKAESAHARLEVLARRLRHSAISVAWRQWRAVDAQASGKEPANAMVDPEALILISLALMDEERRLGDLVEGWVSRNSELLSVRRAKNLARAYPEKAQERLAGFARVALMQGKDIRWKSVAYRDSERKPATITLPRTGRQRAIRVRLANPAALLLRLRLGLGVGTKADVLGFILGIAGEWASVRDISTATAYTMAGIRRTSEDMAAARLIQSTSGSRAEFRADPETWSRVLELGAGPPPWRHWHQRFAFVAAFLAWTYEMSAAPLTDYTAVVKARELMEKHRFAFASDSVAVWSERTPVTDWPGFVDNAVNALASWMTEHA